MASKFPVHSCIPFDLNLDPYRLILKIRCVCGQFWLLTGNVVNAGHDSCKRPGHFLLRCNHKCKDMRKQDSIQTLCDTSLQRTIKAISYLCLLVSFSVFA